MFSIQAKKREKIGGDFDDIRKEGSLPAVLYGEGIKESLPLLVSEKEFEEALKEAGESSLISLEAEGKKYDVLIHQLARDPLTEKILHIDFFRPSTKKKIEAEVPLSFIGEPSVVREMSGVLVTELSSVHVKALAHALPREIKVNVDVLKTFEDKILIKDLVLPEGVEVLREPEEMVAHVARPTKEEEKKPEPEEGAEEGAEEGGEAEEGKEGAEENKETEAEGKKQENK